MNRQNDPFRDFGIVPDQCSAPEQKVRSCFSSGQIMTQYLMSGAIVALGLLGGMACLVKLPAPLSWGALGVIGIVEVIIFYLAIRNDYAWVELDGRTLRAQHLYTRKVIERSVDDIDELYTNVYKMKSAATVISDKLLGRVRGVTVRFKDKRTPLRICRVDPAMENARELIEAIIFRMAEKRQVKAEICDVDGKPLVSRILWA